MNVYVTDCGDVILPDDFPMKAWRKNGVPDRRFKISAKLRQYEDDLKEAALQEWQKGKDVRGMRAISWASWLSKAA